MKIDLSACRNIIRQFFSYDQHYNTKGNDPINSQNRKIAVARAICLGQVLSILIAGTGIFSQLLAANYNVNFPTTQSVLNYFFLSFYAILLVLRWKQKTTTIFSSNGTYEMSNADYEEERMIHDTDDLKQSSADDEGTGSSDWQILRDEDDRLPFSKHKLILYIILALADVEANYFVVKAYQYTTITSIMFLDTSVIPCVMIISRFFLGARYNLMQLLSVGICLMGMAGIIASDYFLNSASSAQASNPVLGDFFCLISSALYAISNVGEEYLLKRFSKAPLWRGRGSLGRSIKREWGRDSEANLTQFSRLEWLSSVGILGLFISAIQLVLLERHEVSSLQVENVGAVFLCTAGFGLCMFALYSLGPYMIAMSSSTLFNLSLLTSDVFAVFAGVFIFGNSFYFVYFVALMVVFIGLTLFHVQHRFSCNKISV